MAAPSTVPATPSWAPITAAVMAARAPPMSWVADISSRRVFGSGGCSGGAGQGVGVSHGEEGVPGGRGSGAVVPSGTGRPCPPRPTRGTGRSLPNGRRGDQTHTGPPVPGAAVPGCHRGVGGLSPSGPTRTDAPPGGRGVGDGLAPWSVLGRRAPEPAPISCVPCPLPCPSPSWPLPSPWSSSWWAAASPARPGSACGARRDTRTGSPCDGAARALSSLSVRSPCSATGEPARSGCVCWVSV